MGLLTRQVKCAVLMTDMPKVQLPDVYDLICARIRHLVLFLLFLLVLGTRWFLSIVSRLLVSVLVPYYILLSSDFVLYARPGFLIVLVFLVPHIKLVYLAFFILFSIIKVSLCTRALVLDVFCILVRWIHH